MQPSIRLDTAAAGKRGRSVPSQRDWARRTNGTGAAAVGRTAIARQSERIKVVVRERPLLEGETDCGLEASCGPPQSGAKQRSATECSASTRAFPLQIHSDGRTVSINDGERQKAFLYEEAFSARTTQVRCARHPHAPMARTVYCRGSDEPELPRPRHRH
jgi:hypothetical protein